VGWGASFSLNRCDWQEAGKRGRQGAQDELYITRGLFGWGVSLEGAKEKEEGGGVQRNLTKTRIRKLGLDGWKGGELSEASSKGIKRSMKACKGGEIFRQHRFTSVLDRVGERVRQRRESEGLSLKRLCSKAKGVIGDRKFT